MPSDGVCYYGSTTFDLRTILQVAVWLKQYHWNTIGAQLRDCTGLKDASEIWRTSHMHTRDGSITIGNLMNYSQNFEATDGRDKVFGLLGLHRVPEEELRFLLAPDYSKSVGAVLRDMVRYCVLQPTPKKTLYILIFIHYRDESDLRATERPSWVPRFDRKFDEEVRCTFPKHISLDLMDMAHLNPSDLTICSWILTPYPIIPTTTAVRLSIKTSPDLTPTITSYACEELS